MSKDVENRSAMTIAHFRSVSVQNLDVYDEI